MLLLACFFLASTGPGRVKLHKRNALSSRGGVGLRQLGSRGLDRQRCPSVLQEGRGNTDETEELTWRFGGSKSAPLWMIVPMVSTVAVFFYVGLCSMEQSVS